MKILLFFIFGLPAMIFGQWTENFDAGTTMPTGWAAINGGDANGWTFATPGVGTGQSGANVAKIVYSATAHDDYLITKAIAVTAGTSDRLTFYVKSRSSSFLENYEVLLSTTNQTQAAFTTTLKPLAKAPDTWTQLTFNLSAYNGQTVYVAVHATDTDQWELYADTFVVDALPTVPPSCTTLSAPTNGATGVSITPTFTWSSSTNASSYLINLGTTPGGTDVMAGTDVGNVTTYAVPSTSALMYNKTYYMTVIPKNNNGNATGCTESSFTTINIPCPTVNSPGAAATGASTLPTFTWSSVTGATGYKITLGTTSGGTDILNNVDLGNVTSYTYNGTPLSPSTTYYYTIASYNAANSSTGCTVRSFTTTSAALPANDNCSGAVSLTVNPDLACGVTTAGNTLGASQSLAATPCSGNPDDDVWYSFVATSSAHVVTLSNVVSTGTSSTTDVYFNVLSGSCGSLTSVLCSDPNSATVGGLTPGQTYYIRVYTYSGAGYNASFTICVGTPPPPPANDNCANPVSLTLGADFASSAITTTNISATSDQTALSCQASTTNNVWYSVVVPASGNLTIETKAVAGSQYTDSVINAFTGSCGSLVGVGCDDDNGDDNFSKLDLTGQTPGTVLLISVWRWGNSSVFDGQFQISAYDASMLASNEVKFNAKNNIKLYPNPFSDVLNISDAANVKNVLVTDVAGRLVKTIANPGSALNLGELRSGMYLVTLEMKDGSKQTIKAIKK